MKKPNSAKSKVRRKSREELNAAGRERKRLKKHKGNPAGSRINPELNSNKAGAGRDAKTDPRIGSKKPVALLADEVTTKSVATKVKLAPQQELELLENDDRLDQFLTQLEQGQRLTVDEQNYVDKTLARIDELMIILGIEYTDDEESDQQDDIMHLLKGK